MQIKKMASIGPLAHLKQQYIELATAPLDGMWLCGFVPLASHFGLFDGDELIGFFCVNENGFLLQFFVGESNEDLASQLFELILQSEDSPAGMIEGAYASTAEPQYFSLCLDHFSTFKVNALMYQHFDVLKAQSQKKALELKAVESGQLPLAVDFAVSSIGAPEEWLTGYYANLIQRRELFGVWDSGRLLATGESRGYDEYQVGYADVGVVVAKSERGKGMATRVLGALVAMNEANGLKSICSTEHTNIAAQKAISRVGFLARHRIVEFRA